MSPPPTTRTDLEAVVRERAVYWIETARRIYGLTPRRLPMPELVFDLRGRAAGQAVLARRRRLADRIRINTALLASHPDEMLDETVPHEAAHIAVHRRFGRRARPHGDEWRELMTAFGVPARACHQMPVEPTRRLQQFAYRCQCPEPVWLTSIRHNRARRGERYFCRRCGQVLVHAP